MFLEPLPHPCVPTRAVLELFCIGTGLTAGTEVGLGMSPQDHLHPSPQQWSTAHTSKDPEAGSFL